MLHSYHSGCRALVPTLFLLCQWLHPTARAQTPTWTQLSAVGQYTGTTNSCSISATTPGPNGDVYVAGTYYGTVTFGAFPLTNPAGGAFVAKWSPATSTYTWVVPVNAIASIPGLVTSGSSVYIAGDFYGATATLGTISLLNADPSGNTTDAFVAKLTDNGSSADVVWAQRAGGPARDNARDLAANGSSLYMVGDFESTSISFGATTLTKTGQYATSTDAYVAKLTDNGPGSSFGWAQRMGSQLSTGVGAIAVNGPAVYLAGGFGGTAQFGSLSATAPQFDSNLFLARLTDAGPTAAFNWVQTAGSRSTYVTDLAVSGLSVYLTGGFFDNALTFGSTTLVNAGNAPGSNSSTDVFLAKFSDATIAGLPTWALRVGGDDGDFPAALATRGTDVYLLGSFVSNEARFGALSLLNSGRTYNPDIFVAKLADAGPTPQWAWVQSAGGPGNDQATALGLGAGHLYVGGFVTTTAYFGTLPFSYPPNTSLSFLATLSEATGLATGPAKPLAGLQVAPNPARSTAQVQLPAVPGAATATLSLYDALGRAVRTQRVPLPATGGAATLDLRGLAPGLYRLLVQAGYQRHSQALTVE